MYLAVKFPEEISIGVVHSRWIVDFRLRVNEFGAYHKMMLKSKARLETVSH